MRVVLVVTGVVDQRETAGEVILRDLARGKILHELRGPRKRREVRVGEVGQEGELQRAVKPARHLHGAAIALTAHAVEIGVVLAHRVGVELGVVTQPEVAEARLPLRDRQRAQAPAVPQLGRPERGRDEAAALRRDARVQVEGARVGVPGLVLRRLPVPDSEREDRAVVRAAGEVGEIARAPMRARGLRLARAFRRRRRGLAGIRRRWGLAGIRHLRTSRGYRAEDEQED